MTTSSLTLQAGPAATELDQVFEGRIEIGGASTSVAYLSAAGHDWVLFNTGNHLQARELDVASPTVYTLEVEGYIRDIDLVSRGARRFALLAMGTEGIAAVDVSNPAAMSLMTQVGVNYYQSGVTWTEGGGAVIENNIVSGERGDITALVNDGRKLWIANQSFGIHRTSLANLLLADGPVLEPDGTLLIESEVYTLDFAGEQAWGGPLELEYENGRLFAAQGSLGFGIYEPYGLERVGGYNLYTDASVVEDWFIDMDVSLEVLPGQVDPDTGMPTARQASFEILKVWHEGVDAPTPWADFDRYGKWYYQAKDLAVADFGDMSIAYVAYGLGGLVAVDVSGYRTATSASPVEGVYLGYAPGVPAHGPDDPTGSEQGGGSESLFPHHGAGMLKESGVVDVAVYGNHVYYSDHFAGLVVLDHADDPAGEWHGAGVPYDNDDPTLGDGVLGDHWPDYEFVTSYDMAPFDPTDHESLPTWMYEAPSLLVSGEIGGHGSRFQLSPWIDPTVANGADVMICVGSGGFAFVDVLDLEATAMEDRFDLIVSVPTTSEVGAAPGGAPTSISIGHTQGVAISDEILYVADGPHGVTAWQLLNPDGSFADEPHLLANTLQDEYPVELDGTTYYPTPHAYGVMFDPVHGTVLTMCQGRGLRRMDVSGVESGVAQVGSPMLMTPLVTDIFEHNTETGSVDGLPKQDHMYDVELVGDLAFTADGGNGLTIYDLTKDPTDLESGFVVGNLGGSAGGKAELGRSTGIALWVDPQTSKRYAMMAAGPRGVGVVDVSDPSAPELIKVFEPIKIEDGKVGKADGRAVDVIVHHRHAYFSYDSFGIVCYSIPDLIAPLPEGVEPTDIWKVQAGTVLFDYRPVAVSRFRLLDLVGYEDATGGALKMHIEPAEPHLYFHVAHGTSGLAKIDWTIKASPQLIELLPTPGEASSVVEFRGRRYVADASGGLVYFE